MVKYITEDKDVDDAIKLITGDRIYASVDTETNSLDPLLLSSKLALVQIKSNKHTVIFNIHYLNQISRNKIVYYLTRPDRKLIFQNAKFDIKWLRVHLGIKRFNSIYCTMDGSKIISAGRSKFGHDLKTLVFENFGVDLDKSSATSNWLNKVLTEKQLHYAAEDVEYLEPMREKQIEQIRKSEQIRVTEIEMRCLEPVAKMELNGCGFDFDRWMKLANRMKLRATRLEYKICNLLQEKGSSNNGMLFQNLTTIKFTPQSIIRELLHLGVPVPQKINPKGKLVYTIAKDNLEEIADTHPAIPLLIRHATYKKAHDTYGKKWQKFIHPVTKRLHSNFTKIGAETGRFSGSKPNLMSIPSDNRYRRCFIPAKGRKLIWGDYAQIELKILAEFCGDEAMINSFNEGLDFHTQTASLVFKVPYDKVHEEKILRRRAKDLNFGIVYGIGAKRFAAQSGISETEAEELMSNYFNIYRKLDQWLRWANEEAIKFRRSRTLTGRLMKHEFDSRKYQEVSLAGRNGMNMPIQGTSADITKMAMILLYDRHQDTIDQTNVVHDEIIGEADEDIAEREAENMRTCLIDAAQSIVKKVKITVDMHIADEWSK